GPITRNTSRSFAMSSAADASAPSAPTPATSNSAVDASATARPKRGPILIALVALGAVAGGAVYISRIGMETTENAQVDAEVVSVPARVSGVVEKVLFVENQHVKAGDELAELDSAPA